MNNKFLASVLAISVSIVNLPKIDVSAEDTSTTAVAESFNVANYTALETEHFKIIYPTSELSRTEEVSKELESNYERITKNLGVTLDKKTTVNLFADKESLHKSIGCCGKKELEWITGTGHNGVIKSTLALDTNRLKQVLVHEFTHIVTEKLNSDYIPFVFKEGIATYEARQKNIKDELKFIKELPSECDWLFKGSFSNYALAYSFTEFVVENYGYEKIIELLRVDYRHYKFDLNSIRDIYSKWREYVLTSLEH